MKRIRLSQFCSLFLSFMLLISPLPLAAMVESFAEQNKQESHIVTKDNSYIYLNNTLHNIAEFIYTMSSLDDDLESPIHELKQYISDGFTIALQDEVLQIFGYADWLLEQEHIAIENVQRNKLIATIDSLVEAIIDGDLAVDADVSVNKSKLPLWVINKRINVKGKATFDSDVIIQGKTRLHSPAKFYKRAHFKDNVRIDGTASIQDAVIENLTLPSGINITDLTLNSLSVTNVVVDNLQVNSCIPDLCVENLTIENGSVSGTLSIDNAVIENLDLTGGLLITDVTLGTASITSAVVENLQVNGCIPHLCVDDLSVVNGSVSGTLSITDAIIQSLDLTGGLTINNLTLNSLTATDIVTDNLQVNGCIPHLCVDDLSVVNGSVSGIFSITDAVIQSLDLTGGLIVNNLILSSLTATDAVIGNLEVTNCISELCVTRATITDLAVTGTLSVTDAFIEHLDIAQNTLHFDDSSGINYVGMTAPVTVPTSYTVNLPAAAPTANQLLRANAITPTSLEWATDGGSVLPTISETIYVTVYGNDITGDGSFSNPYASLLKAVDVANGIASLAYPVVIFMGPGTYFENNSVTPITINAQGISIIGNSATAVSIVPTTSSNNLLLVNQTVTISNMTFLVLVPGVSTAAAISFAVGQLSDINNIRILNFAIGALCAGDATDSYVFDTCLFVGNGTGIVVNDTIVNTNACTFLGTNELTGPPINTGITVTGANATAVINTGSCVLCNNGFEVSNNATISIAATVFKINIADIIVSTAAHATLTGCSFEITNSPTDIDVQFSGAGTTGYLIGCEFNGSSTLGAPEATGILVTDNAFVEIDGGTLTNYTTGIQIGFPSDTSSTILSTNAFAIRNCVTDIQQQGTSSVNFNAGIASGSKVLINNPTNVSLAFFNLDNNNALAIGSTANKNTTLIQAEIGVGMQPTIDYTSSLYSTQAIGITNPSTNPTSLYVVSNNNADVAAITTNRADTAGVRLMSDTAVPVGGTSALRGWDIYKNGTTAELIFEYQNNDLLLLGSSLPHTVIEFNGETNQVQLPTDGTQIVFSGDTNVYRTFVNSVGVLKTDNNFIVGTLTPGRVVVTDGSTDELASSITTATELSYLSGVTSSIQTQLNNKVSRSGDTMTGTLQLPAGSTGSPSLTFTGNSGVGLSANTSNLSFSTLGLERMAISSGGVVSIDAFAVPGVVHNDNSGNLSSSLIINADVAASAAIIDSKLATISTAGKVANSATTATSSNNPSTIVLRDASGNFSAGIITANLIGNATTATSTGSFTGSLAGDVTGTQSATVVSFVGGQTAANVAAATVLANAATSVDTNGAIVRRDGSGNFSATTITAHLTGSASNNVLKVGDTMTGTLNMATQNAIDFYDAANTAYVGINAPAVVPTSYTLSLPSAVPTAHQIMRANATTPTNLEWATVGGSVPPAVSETIYVTTYGNDSTGDGSFDNPYLTLAKAIDVANGLASPINLVAIIIAAGTYFEDNSAGPLTVMAQGISIVSPSAGAVTILPLTTSNDLLLLTQTVYIANITFAANGVSTATGVVATAGEFSSFDSVQFFGFQIGLECSGGEAASYGLNSCFFVSNTTGLFINNTIVEADTCGFLGAASITGTPINTGILIDGSQALCLIDGGLCGACVTGIQVQNNANATLSGVSFSFDNFDLVQTSGSILTLSGCNFEFTTASTDIDIQISGAGTRANIIGCSLNGNSDVGVAQGTAIIVSGGAFVDISSGKIENYGTALQVGTALDTSSTSVTASSLSIRNSTTADIAQEGSSSLSFVSGIASSAKISINDTTNVSVSFADLGDNNALTIGSGSNVNTTLLQPYIDPANHPSIEYLSSLYSTQAVGFENLFGFPSTSYVLANNNATLSAITTLRTDTAGVRLVSDTASPVGGTSALRGWDIIKNGSAAQLAFNYQNSDTVGQSAIAEYTVIQLDGVNNQLQLPSTTTAPKIVFGGDTNVYRSSAGVLKTDNNFIVGTLTPGKAVVTDSVTDQLTSSITTGTEISYLSGVTSLIQPQLNNKVSRSGDTMTGTLQLPAGSTGSPSLTFTSNSGVGLSANTSNLSFSTLGLERMAISSGGVVSIDNFVVPGVVHNDSSGNLSSSLVTNADIVANAGIIDSKLATISTAGKVANSATTATSANTATTIVLRDSSGNFSAGNISASLNGNATSATTAGSFSGSLAGDVTGTQSATVVSLVGGQTAANVASATVAANAATSADTNGAIVKRDASGNFNAGTISMADAVITTLATITPFNSAGVVHNDASGNLSSSLITNVDVSNTAAITDSKLATISSSGKVANSATTATSGNTLNAIVARDGSGNFTAGTITASLTGNATTATTATNFSGALAGDVTGTQSATVVSTVGGQSAANVASAVTTVQAATSAPTASTLVLRDGTGSFAAHDISMVDSIVTGTSTITPFNSAGVVHNNASGLLSSSLIVNADISGSAGITDSKLAMISTAGKIANSATTATNLSMPSTIVERDSSQNFSAGTITANLMGSASNNVLKAGDAMTGTLTMATQNAVDFQDAGGVNFVGFNAPTAVASSYTMSLPLTVPTIGQTMRAGALVATNLEWVTEGGSITPPTSRIVYVTKYGNDVTGDGSFDLPYASLSKAVEVANTLSSAANPITISMGPGTYIEDNSVNPITITSQGIAIYGDSLASVIILPTTSSNLLLLANESVVIDRMGFIANGTSTAAAISLTQGSLSAFTDIRIIGFQTGISCSGTKFDNYEFNNCFFIGNGTALTNNDTVITCYNCSFIGSADLSGPANNGLVITGSTSFSVIDGGILGLCQTALNVTNNAYVTVNAMVFEYNESDFVITSGAQATLSGSSFQVTLNPSDVKVQASGAGTSLQITGCKFDGTNGLGNPFATAVMVSDEATINISSSGIYNYTTALQVGNSTDASTTMLQAFSTLIKGSATYDILQQGSSSLNFTSSSASGNKISINDPTNVQAAFFDNDDSNALTIGSSGNMNTVLLQPYINSVNSPSLEYLSSLYSTQGIGFNNEFGSPSTAYVLANNNATLAAITTLNTDTAGVRLVSDTASPVGGTSALRGWDIIKNGSAAQLAFNYQNSDVSGQSVIPEYTVMQLDGVNNQLQLPSTALAEPQIVFGGDTNLYRSGVGVLQTNNNFIVGTLTPGFVVQTDSSTNQLESSAVTNTELGYVSGVTSSIQTQLNGKVSKAGDIMTGALQLPAGGTTSPSLTFTGSTTTGLSATGDNLSLSANGAERMKLSSTGVVSIDGFVGAAGVVHNDVNGNLSSSLIIDADITASIITNDKLATISSSDVPGYIVVRNGSGNFATNMITIDGTVTNSTDVTTKAYVDALVATGFEVKAPALVASTTNVTLSGLQTVDGVTLSTNDRVLLVGQTNSVQNGLWLAQSGAWTRPADFASGTEAGTAYVLVTSGNTYAGASWVCNTPAAIIDTDPLVFAEFSLPSSTTGANIGAGTGLVFANKTGETLNFRSLIAGTHLTYTTNTSDITLTTDATSASAVSTIVARDASGNFSAGTITANLTGSASNNLLLTGGTLTGSLQLPIGTIANPSLVFTGSTTTGLSSPATNTLSFNTNGSQAMSISSTGVVAINSLMPTAGVVHNDSSGNLSSSLIVNLDISGSAAIADSKLATISTAGKVANSATTATSANTINAIVARDSSGNFNANIISATLNGSATNNVLKAGDTMTGTLQLPAGSTGSPSLTFTGNAGVGLSANTSNLSFSTLGLERMAISSGGVVSIDAFVVPGVVHNDGSGNLSSSLIVNADISATAGIIDSKLATISTAGKVANSATTATSANTATTIVLRDSSGNFSAGNISASLNGNATSATTAGSFSGSLAGDVTGTQSATVVSLVGGQTAANVASATVAANAATSADTNGAIVKRDASGNFNAGTISMADAVITTLATITPFNSAGVVHNDASGNLSSSLITNVDVSNTAAITDSKLATISSSGKVANSATTATSGNTLNAIVARDGSGNFTAGTITASLTGNATTATTATNFSGALAGDVTGTQGATVVSTVGGQSAANVASAVTTVQAATSAPTASTLVLRDGTGSFAAHDISMVDSIVTGTSTITPFNSAGVVHNNASGLLSSSLIVNADISGSAGITDSKLATISTAGKVANSATTATNLSMPSTIVERDSSQNFSAGTITANLTGSASNNVLKAGDAMTGTLTMALQNAIDFQDAGGVNFVGINAPATVPTSYTLSLPATVPAALQVMRGNATTPTNLEWYTPGASVLPAVSGTIYVATFGNDVTGNGSATDPYASLAKAIIVANTLALSGPITITVDTGVYVENNNAGPLAITSSGISIVSPSVNSATIIPANLAQNLLSATTTLTIENITFAANGVSTATGLVLSNGNFSNFTNVQIFGFQTGIECSSGSYGLNSCLFVSNGTGIFVNNATVALHSITIFGATSLTSTAANTGVTISGGQAVCIMDAGVCVVCENGIQIQNNAKATISAVGFGFNVFDIVQSGGSFLTLSGCSFLYTAGSSDIDVQVSGAGTAANIIGCSFDGKNISGTSQATGIQVSGGAKVEISGGTVNDYSTGVIIGAPSDTSSTSLLLSSVCFSNNTTDVQQQGTAALAIDGSTLTNSKIVLNSSTNVHMSFFDIDDTGALTIGALANQNTTLLQAAIDPSDNSINLDYKTSLYGAQAIGIDTELTNPTSLYLVAQNNADIVAVTTLRTDTAGVRLVSDTASPVGGTTALRGWDIIKNGSAAQLAFNYQNSDTVGQSSVAQYTVMQLDGVNNQLQLPSTTIAPKIVFGGDTNVYRSSAGVLKTDNNFIVGTLTLGKAVVTDSVTDQLASSITTGTEISYLSGVTSPLQTQLNNKVSRSGDIMTGTLQLPAGSTGSPSLTFTGNSGVGLSANTSNLSFSTLGLERMAISSGGVVSIDAFVVPGVVHNDNLGNLSSSLIVNADISATAAIIDSKLATISTAGKVANSATTATSANNPSTIVLRDASDNFSAGTITANLIGNATTATSAGSFSGSFSGDVTGTQSATVVSFVGGQTAANVAAATVLANAATSTDTNNAIVRRDASGNFSATTITANLTGSASNNVLKAGDTMTGTLNMATQNAIDFYDAANTAFVGINAPAVVPTSYTVSLPSTVPTAHQVMRANSVTPTNLEWATEGGSVLPANSEMIYVAKYGNDSTGDGSFSNPYLTLSKAVNVANGLATLSNPIVIVVAAGVYVEDNSATPISVNAQGVSIVGASSTGVTIIPSTPANTLLLVNQTALIRDMTFANELGVSSAAGISFSSGAFSSMSNLYIINFQSGVMLAGGVGQSYILDNCLFVGNVTGLVINDTDAECNSCTFVGSTSASGPPANTGINATGVNSNIIVTGATCVECNTGFNINNNATLTASSVTFKVCIFDIVVSSAAQMTLSDCNFAFTNGPGDIEIQVSDAGTFAQIVGCEFNGNSTLGSPEATGIMVSNNAAVEISGGSMTNYTTGLVVGLSTDTSSTRLSASSFTINNCTTDIEQQGTSTLTFNAGVAASSAITVNNATNVSFAYFDTDDNNALTIGSSANMNTTLLQPYIDPVNHPTIEYLSSLYSTQAVGFENLFGFPSTSYVLANNNATLSAITTLRTDTAGVRLVSDTGSPVGGTLALRGWDIIKNGSAAQLAFNYQNSDTIGQSAVAEYTVMQLDGVNNQLQLPTTTIAPKIVFGGDTNLYRTFVNSVGVLKTDNNFIVGTLTPGKAVVTDSMTDELASSITTGTEISYLSGVTSPIQTQLNNKVSRSGDTMTGTLQLPAGSMGSPSLTFTGNSGVGLSANTSNLSFSTLGLERMAISSGGVVSIDAFTVPGVVHNDGSGNLSSSLIVNADISGSAAIADSKLATISTAGKVANSATTATSASNPSTIVLRDASGNFSAGTITANLNGNATTATSAGSFAGSFSGDVTGTQSATVVSFVGGQTAANVAAATVLANAATSADTNGAIVKRDGSGNFSATTITANLTGNVTGNVTGNATTATTATNFTGSLAGDVTGTQGATVVSTVGGVTAANVALGANAANAATSANAVSTIVKRDSAGSFVAQNITAAGNISMVDGIASGFISAPFMSIPITTSLAVGTIQQNGVSVLHTFGTNNTFAGDGAGNFTMSGTGNNTVIGKSALIANTTGASNTVVGSSAGSSITTGSNNVVLGYNITGTTTGNNNIYIDGSGTLSQGNESSVIRIGNTQTAAYIKGIFGVSLTSPQVVTAVSGGQLGSTTAVSLGTSTNTISTLVARDGSGNFSAGTITANLIGNVTGNATTATTATNFIGSLAGDVTGTQSATVVSLVGGVTAANVASGVNAANAATNLDTVSTIVKRDGSGNFSAGTIAANLTGNVTGNVTGNATTATTATNFTGSLAGDVTGTQSATVVSLVGGLTAANVASGANAANAATNLNTASTIVKRDASGNFSAGTITANLTGNVTGNVTGNATTATTATNFTGSLAGDVTGTQSATVVSLVGGVTAGNVASGANAANAATSANTVSMIVRRDGSGNFSATTITANLIGNATTATSATTATNFTGLLAGDVTGTQSATVVSLVGGVTAANVASGANAANAATNLNTASTIVKRDASGNFSAGTITANLIGNVTGNATTATTATNFTGSLAGDVTGTQSATVVSLVGGVTAANVASGANAANAATSANTGGAIVVRDGSGNFSAGTITANLTGNVTGNVTGNATTATTATNFTGSLAGDVTGTQSATVVSLVGGQTAAAVASAVTTVNAATSANTASTLVKRDASGNFSAGIISANSISIPTTASLAIGTIQQNGVSLLHTFGTNNTFVGDGAGNFNAGIGSNNTAVGASALTANTTGIDNTAFGASALAANTTAQNNTAIGFNALNAVQTSGNNTAIGTRALAVNTVAGNTAVGNSALALNTTGTGLVAVGASALGANTIGSFNTGLGTNVLSANTTGSNNTAAGYNALASNTIGTTNTALGYLALNLNTTGVSNTALGSSALVANTIGINNTAVGSSALTANTTGVSNTVFGASAGLAITSGSNNVVLGYNITGTTVGNNNIYIDGSGTLSQGNESNTIRIGNTQTTAFMKGIFGVSLTSPQVVTAVSGGQLGSATAVSLGTSANTISTLVARDGSGNFSAGTITANLTGNVTGNVTGNATTATTATNFTGSLAGDVTGTQSATVVSLVGGVTAANVASGANAANAATNLNTASTIVKRDASGNFSAGTITANLTGNVTGNVTGNATTATTATNFTGSLAGDVTGTQSATVVSLVGGKTASAVASAVTTVNAATSADIANTLVLRDNTGSFTAANITALGDMTMVDAIVSGFISIPITSGLSVGTIQQNGVSLLHTFGTSNTFVGDSAGNFTPGMGSSNTGVGASALPVNAAGANNTAVGFGALFFNTAGSSNTAVGANALAANTTGINNTAVGNGALSSNTVSGNVAVGSSALANNTTGIQNTAVGLNALTANGASGNTACGSSALAANIAGISNTAVGASALATNTVGTTNTAVGFNALTVNTVSGNTAVGSSALAVSTTATGVTAVGSSALAANTTGISNTAVGASALATNSVGTTNTAVGFNALTVNTVSGNTAVGSSALAVSTTATGVTAVGSSALAANTTGISNTAVGASALATNSVGTTNTAVGFNALKVNTVSGNTAIGSSALAANTTGIDNTVVGASAGAAVTTGSHNVVIGFNTGASLTAGTNNIYIDGSGSLNPANEINTIRIGNTTTKQTTCFIQGISGATSASGVAVLVNTSGQLGTTTSSARFKHNIMPMKEASATIFDLNPVTFAYNSDETEATQYGLIAEDVEQIFPDLVVREEDGRPYTVRYEVLPVLLLNEMKKQKHSLQDMQKTIDLQQNSIDDLLVAVNSLKQQVNDFMYTNVTA